MWVSGEGTMVTLNRLSVEDPDDGGPLLPVVAETTTPTPVSHRQRVVINTESRDFFLSRYFHIEIAKAGGQATTIKPQIRLQIF